MLRPWLVRRGPFVGSCSGICMEMDINAPEGRRYFLYGNTERNVHDLLSSAFSPGGTFLDVGANWGFYALLAAKRLGREGRSIAFEPDPGNIETIRKNLSLNPGIEIAIEAVAVSDGKGEATFHVGDNDAQGSILEGPYCSGNETLTVPTISLDEYIDEKGIDRVDVMKMDIEGGEVLALEGMAKGLRAGRYGLIVLEWHGPFITDMGERPHRAIELLTSAGYSMQSIPRHRSDNRLTPITPEEIGDERLHLLCKPPA